MKTCEHCIYKGKNDKALNAFECRFNPPLAVPLVGPQGIAGVAAVRAPVKNDTPACGQYQEKSPKLTN